MAVSFRGEIHRTGQGGHAVVVPKEIAATFSTKRPAVEVVLNGTGFAARLAVYGAQCYLGVRKDQLRAAGVAAGDTVDITLTEVAVDEPASAPAVDSPELIAALAADEAAGRAYADLPPEHRQEYARWVGASATEEVRSARVARTLARLARRATDG